MEESSAGILCATPENPNFFGIATSLKPHLKAAGGLSSLEDGQTTTMVSLAGIICAT